jgi:hypothetical protein
MSDLQRCVVQFIHPGGEHGPDEAGGKRWNRGLHKRKFLQVPGEYLTARDGRAYADDLVFWGEREPESDVSAIIAPVAAGPKFLHRPYYVRPRAYPGDLQNTDPFVFGDHFLYTLCRQTKPVGGHARPTFLRDLAAGSLILFGSLKGGGFVLDTAFVVADGVLHDAERWPSSLSVPRTRQRGRTSFGCTAEQHRRRVSRACSASRLAFLLGSEARDSPDLRWRSRTSLLPG